MSKLIYSASAQVLENTYTNINSTNTAVNTLYKSVAFTGDGYMYTHGKKFKLFLVTDAVQGLQFGISNGTAQVTVDGISVGSGTVVLQVTGDNIVTASTASGAVTLTHHQYLNINDPTTYGSSVKIPTITVDKYGHISAITESDIDPTKIVASQTSAAGTYYVTGVTGNNAQNPVYVTGIYFDGSGNLHATTIYQGNSTLLNTYAPLSHVNVTANNATAGHVLLSDTYGDTLDESGGTAATPKAVNSALTAAKNYADGIVAAQDAMVFAGTINASGVITSHNSDLFTATDNTTNISATSYKVGWTFRFIEAGTFNGNDVEVGDMIIAVKDKASVFAIGDWTILQTNISGALTATSNLNGVLYANNSRSVQSLAFSNGVLTYNGSSLAFVNKNTLWRTISVGETSIGTNALTLKLGNYITLANNNGEVTFNVNAAGIINTANALTISKGNTDFTYTPKDGAALLIGSHLSLSQDSNSNWTLNHVTIGSAVTTATLGKITVDAYGHVTGITEVTTLPNQYNLKIANNSGTALASYNGSAEKILKFVNGTDISLTLAESSGTVTVTPSITHKYRPIQFYAEDDSQESVVVLNTGDSGYLTLIGGDNVTLSNKNASGNNLAGGSIRINSLNTWRAVNAYANRSSVYSKASIGTGSLDFGEDFIYSSNEICLAWTEIDDNGTITYG